MVSEKWLNSAKFAMHIKSQDYKNQDKETQPPELLWQPVAKVWDGWPSTFPYFPLNPAKWTGRYKFDKASDNKEQPKKAQKDAFI